MAKVHDQGARGDAEGRSAATAEDVVVTERLKFAAAVEANVTSAGTEQFAPFGVGDTEQLSEAVPLAPAPPRESV